MTLEDVKAGDKVFLSGGGWERTLQVVTVAKVGKVHIILPSGQKFRKVSGYRVGDSTWSLHHAQIRPYDAQEWQEYRAEQLDARMRRQLTEFDWRRADIQFVRTVHALLPARQLPARQEESLDVK